MKKDTTYSQHSECDGTDVTILATQTCYISMSTLTSSEFGFELGDLVVVKIRARNEKGWGIYSPTNLLGALVEEVPLAPTTAPRRGVKTNEFRISVEWEFLTTYEQRGGSYIDSYEL